jgi:predicted aspartyl protease
LIIFWIFISTACTTSRSAVVWPSDKAQKETTSFQSIPLHQHHKLLLIKGEANGKSGYFILDTGAPFLILNEAHYPEHTIDPTREVTGVNGLVREAQVLEVQALKLGEVKFIRQMADVTDLSHIEKKRGVKILGLIGVSLFKGLAVEIDLRKRSLTIFTTGKGGSGTRPSVASSSSESIILPFKFRGALIEIEAKINDRSYRVAFDTGAESFLFDQRLLAKDAIQSSLLTRKQLLSSDGSEAAVEIRKLPKMVIGVDLNRLPMLVTDFRRMRSTGLNVDGLIGYDLMASGVVTINFSTRTMQIKPYKKA